MNKGPPCLFLHTRFVSDSCVRITRGPPFFAPWIDYVWGRSYTWDRNSNPPWEIRRCPTFFILAIAYMHKWSVILQHSSLWFSKKSRLYPIAIIIERIYNDDRVLRKFKEIPRRRPPTITWRSQAYLPPFFFFFFFPLVFFLILSRNSPSRLSSVWEKELLLLVDNNTAEGISLYMLKG